MTLVKEGLSTSTEVVAVGEPKIEDVTNEEPIEGIEVDHLLTVKNWAHQTPDWRLLNVLFDILSEEQLQYTCSNGNSVFKNMTTFLRLALTNPRENMDSTENAMNQVKSYILSYLFPHAFNRSLGFLSADLTVLYFDILFQAQMI